ncbi:site-specific integrase [Brumimicrobium aurantiacum]|nr:site-specific integrase [Brumimicrobium aurantiacum]
MKTKYIFNRKKRLNTKGQAPVEVMIYLSRKKRIFRSTGVFIAPKFWDENKNELKKSIPNYQELNHKLILKRHSLEDQVIKEAMSGDFSSVTLGTQKVKLFEFFEHRVIKVTNSELTEGTQMIYRRTLRYLKEFRKEDFPITKVDVFFLESFNIFLKETKKLKLNGRASLMLRLKTVMNVAVNDGVVDYAKNPFRTFKIHQVEPETHSLTLEELTRIENLDMSLRPELDKTRDMFLFSCYTSLRFGDLINLSFENFEVLEQGRIRLTYIQEKLRHRSAKKVQWIISDFWGGKIDKIILKYFKKFENVKDVQKDIRFFFRYTNQHYNRQLKELQNFAGIKQELHSHLARHTCITLLVNDFGLDITKAQMIAGHSKMEMTRKYLRVTERDLETAARNINWDK